MHDVIKKLHITNVIVNCHVTIISLKMMSKYKYYVTCYVE